MKVIKIISKCIFWVLILALLLSPLALIYELSNREMEQYKMPDPPQFVQTSYGTVVQAERRDMAETESVSGIEAGEWFDTGYGAIKGGS